MRVNALKLAHAMAVNGFTMGETTKVTGLTQGQLRAMENRDKVRFRRVYRCAYGPHHPIFADLAAARLRATWDAVCAAARG